MRQILVFLMLLYAACFGAYDNSDVTIINGGVITNTGGIVTVGTGAEGAQNLDASANTIFDTRNSLRLPPTGTYTITEVTFWTGSVDTNVGGGELAIYRIGDADADGNDDIQCISKQTVAAFSGTANAAAGGTEDKWVVDTSASLTGAMNGDILVFQITCSGAVGVKSWNIPGSGNALIYLTHSDQVGAVGSWISDYAASATHTITGTPLCIQYKYTDNNFYATTIDTSSHTFGTSQTYFLPYYDITGGQYIMLEGVEVPDTETLEIDLEYVTTTGVGIEKKVYFDFSVATPVAKMTLANGTTTVNSASQNCSVELPDPVTPDTYDIYIYRGTSGTSEQPWDCLFINKTNGSAFRGGTNASPVDIQVTSVSMGEEYKDRLSDKDGYGNPTHYSPYKWAAIQIVNAGGNVDIDDIHICRKPVLIIGDSISTTDYVGYYLPSAFTEPRYGIQTGIGGTFVTLSDSALVSILDRWRNGAVYFRDVVVCPVNGPGVNDLAAINDDADEVSPTVAQVLGGISRIVGDSLQQDEGGYYFGGTNDVVICNMIPPNPADVVHAAHANYFGSYSQERDARLAVNVLLKVMSYKYNVPLADVSQYAGEYSGTPSVHPKKTAADAGWIASKIAQAYEHNIVADIRNPTPRRLTHRNTYFLD